MFRTIIGNEPIKDRLVKLIKNQRLPQSLLFCGKEGIGKRLFALEVAKSVVCTDLKEGLPCGVCPSCIRAVTFNLPTSGKKKDYESVSFSEHPDVGMVVPNKQNIYVDAIRNLVEESQFRPFEARGRVFIIDEAEKLGLTRKAAANALLKTLEEPSEGCYLILITSQPSSLLQTIHSRCQKIRFASVEKSLITEFLVSEHGFEKSDAELAASFSEGSIAEAMGMDLDSFRETRHVLLSALNASNGNDGLHKVLEASDVITNAKAKVRFEDSLRIAQELIRDAVSIKTEAAERIVNSDIQDEIEEVFEGISLLELGTKIELIEDLKKSLRINANKRANTDAAFMKMAGNGRN